MIIFKEKLTNEYINSLFGLKAELELKEYNLYNRVDYILNFVYDKFGGNVVSWTFRDNKYYVDDISVRTIDVVSKEFIKDIYLIDKFNNDWRFTNSLPSRWLFEDFEDEVVIGIQKVKDNNHLDEERYEDYKRGFKIGACGESVLSQLGTQEPKHADMFHRGHTDGYKTFADHMRYFKYGK